jgi:hypothetical protein
MYRMEINIAPLKTVVTALYICQRENSDIRIGNSTIRTIIIFILSARTFGCSSIRSYSQCIYQQYRIDLGVKFNVSHSQMIIHLANYFSSWPTEGI